MMTDLSKKEPTSNSVSQTTTVTEGKPEYCRSATVLALQSVIIRSQ